jgi:hypothetical protein
MYEITKYTPTLYSTLLLQLLKTVMPGNSCFGSSLLFKDGALQVGFAVLWALMACLRIEDSFDILLD